MQTNIYADMVELVNRTCVPLTVTWDSKDFLLAPNYTADGQFRPEVRNIVPSIVVGFARNQHPLMGSEDPMDPAHWEALVGVKAPEGKTQRDPLDYLAPEQLKGSVSRVVLAEYLNDASLKVVAGRGPHRPSEARLPHVDGGGMTQFDTARGA